MLRKFPTFFPFEGLVGGLIFDVKIPLFCINTWGKFGLPGDKAHLEVLLLSEVATLCIGLLNFSLNFGDSGFATLQSELHLCNFDNKSCIYFDGTSIPDFRELNVGAIYDGAPIFLPKTGESKLLYNIWDKLINFPCSMQCRILLSCAKFSDCRGHMVVAILVPFLKSITNQFLL